MRILFLSHTADSGVFRVGSHHLARELGAAGHDVAHLSTPVTGGHLARLVDADVRARIAMAGRVQRRGNVRHGVAAAPLPLRFGGPNHGAGTVHLRMMLGRQWLKSVDVVFVDQPLFGPLVRRVAPAARVVYRPTDSHDPSTPIGRAERALVGEADGVVATSPSVLASLGSGADALPSMILENGVELGRFASVDGGWAPRPSDVVYVGALDHRFDFAAVATAAHALPATEFDLIGPPPGRVPVELPPNVRLRGPVAYDALPATLARYRVGILPLNDAPVNAGRSPMKYFEYLATGLHVIARSTPAIDRLAGPGVATYREADDIAPLIVDALSAPVNAAGATYAAGFDWAARAAQLAGFADELAAR